MCKYPARPGSTRLGSAQQLHSHRDSMQILTWFCSPRSDPDSVVLCVLATDAEDDDDIALQIHFTLLQAFCCDNDVNILRVSGMRRLAHVLEGSPEDCNGNEHEPRDLHCILVTVSPRA